MKDYIIPQLVKYKNTDDLLNNSDKPRSLFDDRKDDISIANLLNENFVCIVGEPGIGKSRLIEEIKKTLSKDSYLSCTASEFSTEVTSNEIEYCIIDALDEVEEYRFYKTLQSIKQYKGDNPDVKVLFTCRKHYVASYAQHFASCKELAYAELFRLKDADVERVINECAPNIKSHVLKSTKLRELLTNPRYLTFLLKYAEQKKEISNIGELFEFIVSESIQTAIKNSKYIINADNTKILIQRTLEKVAFIMEISSRKQISKDELYTILDEMKGNMTQMLIANFDLLFLGNRILKDTNGILQFENTEIQEYLAAKELCRQDNIESVLYDIAVQKELKHIYPNWYDIIPHISYGEDKAHSFINIIKLIVSYESSLENESFDSLLRYVDSSLLSLQQKEDLFTVMFEHYLHVPSYIRWKGQILKLMQECYTSRCDKLLMPPYETLNNIQLANISAILEVIVHVDKLAKSVSMYWTNAANTLFQKEDEYSKLASLDLHKALNNKDELILLAESYNSFTKIVKEKYCEITGYEHFTCKNVVDCWLEDCYKRNANAINAVLCIEDISTMIYAYNSIINANKLYEFFNPEGSLLVCYELYLTKQFDIIWENAIGSKLVITRIIAYYIDNHSYSNHSAINPAIKKILLEKETGEAFIGYFNRKWDLGNMLSRFNEELVDAELLSTLDKLLHNLEWEDWYIDNILTNLTNKIRKDEVKKASILEFITRYAKTFERWDESPSEGTVEIEKNPILTATYQSLSDPNVSMVEKYEAAFKLSKHIEFIQHQDFQPLTNVIEAFLEGIDLDEMTLKKTSETSYSLSLELIKIPSFINLMINLDYIELITKYKFVLAKTLPIVCCTSTDLDTSKITNSYKSVIGILDEEEKDELMAWWKSRGDDFLDVSPESIFACITDYGIDALSYKLEEYINTYVNQQNNLSYKLTASKALDLISEGYLDWDIGQYRRLFETLTDDSIGSIKMQCNTILIKKYRDLYAITWRIEYLKGNVVKSIHNETGHVRPISMAESEMISSNPSMFRCFMNIKGDEILTEQMLDLFDFALKLCVKPDTQEYSSYLLRQIYLFFLNVDNGSTFSLLRKKVERFNADNTSFLANSIMNNAEMMYLQKEESSINKSIRLYNKCVEDSHLSIRNNGDFIRYFKQIQFEVQKEIQDQGIYSLVRQETLSEDFIQRELKNTIITKCCQMGLEAVQIDREVTLQDNKRTDFLIRYGMCNPIMVELKLLHNKEIQKSEERKKYKDKFVQYANATNACMSVFWVFDVHKNGSNKTNFEALRLEYQTLANSLVLLTDCKCSSGFETGISSKKQTRNNTNKKKKKH